MTLPPRLFPEKEFEEVWKIELTYPHHFEHSGIKEGTARLEYTYLTQSMMAMLTHPHAKLEGIVVKDCTHILSELRMVKDDGELKRIRKAAMVAEKAKEAAIEAVKPGVPENQVAA